MPSPIVMVEIAGAVLFIGAVLVIGAAQRKDDGDG